MNLRELQKLEVGDEVYWRGPADGDAAGTYRVMEIITESGLIEDLDSVAVLSDSDGACTEVYADELL
jgi:hypothetical protein